MSTWPVVGWVIRDRIFSSVDLPAPLRPMIPTTSPGGASKFTSLRAQIVVSEFPFRRNRPKGLRKALVIESRRVGGHSRLAPMRYSLLIFSALMIGLINLIIRAQTGENLGSAELPPGGSEPEVLDIFKLCQRTCAPPA